MTIELAELEHPQIEEPVHEEKRSNRLRWIVLAVALGIWVVLGYLLQGKATQDLPVSTLTDFQEWLNELRTFVADAKNDGNPLFLPLDWISSAIEWVYSLFERIFVSDSARPGGVAQIGWVGVVAIALWVAYALSGVRVALLSLVVFLSFGYLGYWSESLETLIVTGISVALCVLIGLPLGIWMSRSHRATSWITPVLDTMQTMPAFAYLAPLVLLFGIGPVGAVISTLIYALPPLVRISAYGLRTVSPTTVEATTALGSTSNQLLTKVQLPMARRTIIVGLNQTIMAALSMAVIAAFIGGPGLGIPIVRSLSVLNVGVSFVAGMCIVLMAILLDRGTVAAGERSEAASRQHGGAGRRRNIILAVAGGVGVVIVYLSNSQLRWNVFPESDLGARIAERVNDWVAQFVESFGDITTWISNTVTEWFLNPLDDLLANAPWWLVAAMILTVAATMGGWAKEGQGRDAQGRVLAGCTTSVVAVFAAGYWAGNTPDINWLIYWGAIVLLLAAGSSLGAGGALYPTTICLVLLFGVGLWQDSMTTLAMTLVATVMVMILGVMIGVWMGRSRRADAFIRPILDALQTMPPLVYLVPALALFPVGRFLAIIAAVLYAAPVAIKITADGIRGVAATTVEAAHSLGSSRWQMVSKVQVPMSKGSIVLAANQGLLFVLSMVVIGGLVGGGSLGFLVIQGFSQQQQFGKGLAAGIAITALGIMLDRITVHTAARYGRAEN